MSVINTNIESLFTPSTLLANSRPMTSGMEVPVSGSATSSDNRLRSDLSVSLHLSGTIRSLDQAVHQTNDRIGRLQTAEAALLQQTQWMQRMRELASQATREGLPPEQQERLQQQFQELRTAVDTIGDRLQWQGERVSIGSEFSPPAPTPQQAVTMAFDEVNTEVMTPGDSLSITIAGVKYESVFDGQGFPPFMMPGGRPAPSDQFEIRIDTINNRVTVKAKMTEPFTVTAAQSEVLARDPIAKALDVTGEAGQSQAMPPSDSLGTGPLGTGPLGTGPLGTGPLGTGPLGTRIDTQESPPPRSYSAEPPPERAPVDLALQGMRFGTTESGPAGVVLNQSPTANLENASLRTQEAAEDALPKLDTALSVLQQQRESISSVINRLAVAEDPLASSRIAANPRVFDTEYLETMKALSQAQIREHMDIALLAQANPKPATVIFLLQ